MVGRLLPTVVGRLLVKDVGDPKSTMLVGKAVLAVVRRVDEEVCEVGSLRSVDESDPSSVLDGVAAADGVRVEALVEAVDKALVEEAGVVTGIVEVRGLLAKLLFTQSLVLSLHWYPRSQHRPDRQMGPPLQDPPLHMG